MSDENNVLFVRGSENMSDYDDVWDDTLLIDAYDKAVNQAKKIVAKRIAEDSQNETKQMSQDSKYNRSQTKKPFKKWTVGSPCRAVYSADGVVYEATITKIYENSGMCKVQFIGYQNIENVALNSLLESNGLQSQIAQQKEAFEEKANSEITDSEASTHSSRHNFKHIDDDGMNFMYNKNFNRFNRFDRKIFNNNFMPPNVSSSTCGIPPAPPLPPQIMAKLPENDMDALSSMLMSWYMSGFHTGYYHGLKQAQINMQQRRNKNHQ